MMLRYALSKHYRRARNRYPFLRHVSITTALLTLVWFYALHWGERAVFAKHIRACDWTSWEAWPREAAPHRLVLIADPQLVDPHTYPGRPWPLSSLTESYTDRYMARNFRLINRHLDPDTVVFLGDLFDGGREWSTAKALPLKSSQRKYLEDKGVKIGEVKPHFVGKQGEDLRDYVHGEGGRWSKWDWRQWERDFERFANIFYDPHQLYPEPKRTYFEAFDVDADPIAVYNGGKEVTRQEYATVGKSRRLITGLPGNHDLGLGSGVQLAVRNRFINRFGDTNQFNIIGNHSFVGVDALSLSGMSQFDLSNGHEISMEKAKEVLHVWEPTIDWLNTINWTASATVARAMDEMFFTTQRPPWKHQVVPPMTTTGQNLAKAHDIKSPHTEVRLPVVLLTHIPLWRDYNAHCGSMREKGESIPISAGYQYQNVITHSLSQTMIQKVSSAGEIVHIFSGDDHDYCDVVHRYNVEGDKKQTTKATIAKSVREITVKSFSWAMGVRKPGFQLVSLWNPIDAKGETVGTPLPTVQTHLCLLPDQLNIFTKYAFGAGATFLALLVRAVILALRGSGAEVEDEAPSPFKMPLPRWKSKANGTANGFATSNTSDGVKGRQRGSSTSHQQSNGHLGVHTQRSYNARTRSVSPNNYNSYTPPPPPPQQRSSSQPNAPLIEKAGYFPDLRWDDPGDSDEESHIGESWMERDGEDDDDSQAKWKRRRRTPGRARRALDLLCASLALVGCPVLIYYSWLIRNG